MKRVQRTMSSTQVQHIDKEVDVPAAMRDKLTDEESAREHLADSLRGTARRISRQVERQLQVWRTLRDSETDTKRNWMVFARAPETGSAGQLQLLRRSFNAMDEWTKQVLTLHTNRSTPGSIEVSWSDSEKHETNRREHADRNHLSFRGIQKTKAPQEDAEHEAGMQVMFKEWHAHWQGWAKGPRPRQAVGKHGAQKARGSLGSSTGGYAQTGCCGLQEYHGEEGVDGFHPRVPSCLSEKCCGGRLTPVREAEMAEVRPASASTTLFWLIPTSTTSARPTALLPTLKRWWEWLRASACSECVRDVRKGWDALLELETMDLEGGQEAEW